MKNQPEIRLDGFEGEWETRTFDEVFSFVGNNTLPRAELNYHTGNCLNIHYGDILTKLGSITAATPANLPYISDPDFLRNNQHKVLRDGDIVLADTAEDDTVGKVTEVQCVSSNAVFAGLHTFACRPHMSFAPSFLGYYMNSPTYHRQVVERAQGTKVTSISKELILDTEVRFPRKDEQRAIGNFFADLDTTITESTTKIEKLKNLRATMLVKMFPQGSSKVPEIRIGGFEGEWDEAKLEDFASTIQDGDWIESRDQSNEGIRLLQTGNVGLGEFKDKPGHYKWISDETFERLNCTEVSPGDILISRLPDPVGRACIVPDLGTRMITAVDCTIVKPKKEISTDFLIAQLRSEAYLDEVSAQVAGSTRQRISRSNLQEIELLSTDPEEQKAIGTFFRELDELIDAEELKLTKLSNLKNTFLTKMFV